MFKIEDDSLNYYGPRPTTLEEAWDISIEKWRIIVENPGIKDGAHLTCGLCMVFSCNGCPVAGHYVCRETPYYDYVDNPTRENAQKELDFLLNLRDSGREGGITESYDSYNQKL